MLRSSKFKISFFAFIFIATSSLFSQESMPKNYQSLLWQISGNGLKKPSYLYGTMHVSNKLAFNLLDSFFIALKNSEAVALELNMDDWMDDIILRMEAEKNKSITNYYNITDGFYRNAFKIDAPDEDDLKSILRFRPNISNHLMYRNSKQNSDYEEDNYLDVFIFQAGKKLNKKMVGLEVFKTTEELSIKANREDAEEYEIEDKEKEEEREQNRLRLKELRGDKAYYEVLEDAYRKGDLDLLDSLNQLSNSKGFMKYMLYERNDIMARRMDSVMQKMTLFTGVGASHLPGKLGVIELLRKMGYTVRPVNTNKSDIKTKTQIDETRYPTKFTTQVIPDSAFSVAVPGKLSEFAVKGSSKYYLFNDIANGSFYCIQRMNHYGKLLNQNQESIRKRIDSLIFENIPGKLLSKKEITNSNGYLGLEIVNKTSKGDYQKHQIFISPTEIFSFKMSGLQDYIQKGTEAESFFSSIKFSEPASSSTNYKSKYGFEVATLENKNVYDATTAGMRLQKEIISSTDKLNNKFSLAMMATLNDYEYIEVDTFELNMLAERFCLESNKMLISKKFSNNESTPSILFKAETKNKPEQKIYGKVIINGPNYYLLCSDDDSANASNYFSSFKIKEINYSLPFVNYNDTSLFFSVNMQMKRNTYSDLVDEENFARKKRGKKEKDFKLKQEFLPHRDSKIFSSPETKECVYVEYRKFARYFQYETMDEFWEQRIKNISNNKSLKVSRKNLVNNKSYNEYSFLLTDTGSVRGVYIKCIQHCGVLYILKSVIDTTKNLSGFTKTFYETFKPKDTCIGFEITENKLDKFFFDRIYDKDTLISKPAKAAIEYVQANMLPSNVPALIKTISKMEFNSLSTEDKIELIACFEKVKSKETLPFLEKLYQQYTDSVEIELGILRTISSLKTIDASQLFLKLLRYDVPITADDNSIEEMFDSFSDSLQIAQNLFPEIIKYAAYPEYKEIIYTLMAETFEAKLLKSKVYNKYLSTIMLDANYELKKYISNKDKDDEKYSYSNSRSKKIQGELNEDQISIYNFSTLLAPFYKNSDVKKYFSKLISSSKSEKFRASIYAQLITNNYVFADSIYTNYSSSIAGRIMFYRILKAENKLEVFNKKYLNQKELVISQLFGSKDAVKKDTIVLLSSMQVNMEGTAGNLYIFKSKPKDKKLWKLGYSALQPLDNTLVNFNPEFEKNNFAFDSENQQQKEITNVLRKIRVEGHKRASYKDFDKDSNNYNFNYLD